MAILQHDPTQRGGFLVRCLEQCGMETKVFCPDEGDSLPRSAPDYSGIVLLGSNRSVNDPVDWIAEELHFVRSAMHLDVPVLGHCFGAQMMAKSLGAHVCRNAWANIGWSRLHVTPHGTALFGADEVVGFNWHYETFAIPTGARRLLYGTHCLNKAFAIGRHMAFQCHFEVTEDIVSEWCEHARAELSVAGGPAVQSRARILADMHSNLPALQATARRIYRQWARSLTPPARRRTAREGAGAAG
ncbi:type 1 glutamine amidotransferase [Piscinibacter gummiphilus]|uniref:type 1 glutamine amidotransferase n=1 Tax=Piscinibacter gummiphilus TaxID=946333 RepID=UPI0012FE10B0|nr:type 1 glutamine amidotransferase [Piscinibacter gummiphilus]